MEKLFNISLQNRKSLKAVLERTPREKLLKIPEGYRNNIWWNIAHTVVTQQLLMYGRSGLPMKLSHELVTKFRKGTVPDGTVTEAEIEEVKASLFSTLETAEADYKAGHFKGYEAFTTANKVEVKSIEDAISFNVFHEGLHIGVILSLLKAV